MPKIQTLSTYSDLELALMVMLNYFGTGSARRQKLGSRYTAVQRIVDQICHGTVPAGKGSGTVDPAKLDAAIKNVFSSELDEIRKEIMKSYEL